MYVTDRGNIAPSARSTARSSARSGPPRPRSSSPRSSTVAARRDRGRRHARVRSAGAPTSRYRSTADQPRGQDEADRAGCGAPRRPRCTGPTAIHSGADLERRMAGRIDARPSCSTAASAASTAGPTSRRYSRTPLGQPFEPRRQQRDRPERVGGEAHQDRSGTSAVLIGRPRPGRRGRGPTAAGRTARRARALGSGPNAELALALVLARPRAAPPSRPAARARRRR